MKTTLLSVFLAFMFFSCQHQKGDYVCPPCDLPCDELAFSKAGNCPNCKMELIKKSDLLAEEALVMNEINIKTGAGKFLIEGGFDPKKTIIIHYYKPENFTADAPVIFVLPGAGRNGDDYRDAWIEASQKYGVLVLTPEYAEKNYPGFWNYNLAGMIYDVNIQEETYKVSQNPEEWIFGDFDRISNAAKGKLNLKADSYDMFGHSAGGQILHRLAIFSPENKANRILASNSGWYTVPTDSEVFPYGLKNNNMVSDQIDFNTRLILFLGEKDNVDETRGHLRRSPEVDKQGLGRVERGIYFFNESKKLAAALNKDFNWKLEIVPNVGHDYKKMSEAAADYLFKNDE